MTIHVDVMIRSCSDHIPPLEKIKKWVNTAYQISKKIELCLCLVDEKEGYQLNKKWRQGTSATNVLSFPAQNISNMPMQTLGDLVICVPVVIQEAHQQKKDIEAHWAHLVIHGTLHLLGYDHQAEKDASEMEALESKMMKKLGYTDPYCNDDMK